MYVLVAIIRKRLKLEQSLYTILQILSLTVFEKTPLYQLFDPEDLQVGQLDNPNQLNLKAYPSGSGSPTCCTGHLGGGTQHGRSSFRVSMGCP